MRQEEKVKLVVAGLFIILILNSIIIFGNARENFFGNENKENLKDFENNQKIFESGLRDGEVRNFEKGCLKQGCFVERNWDEMAYFRDYRYLKYGDYNSNEMKTYLSKGEYLQNSAPIGYTNDFKVYLKNKGESDYFNVLFYLKTSEGVKEYIFRRYVFSGEETVFYFRELSKTKNKFLDWNYKIEN